MYNVGPLGALAATTIAGLVLLAPGGVEGGGEKNGKKQLLILSAIADTDAELLTINGRNLGEEVPVVRFAGIELEVVHHDPFQVLARLPAGTEPGSYLLTVSRGRGRKKNDAFDVAVGLGGDSGAVELLRQQVAAVEARVDGLATSFSPPTLLFVERLTVEEGDLARVVVGLSHASVFETAVGFQTVDGSAIAGTHYQSTAGTLVFEAGETSEEIQIPTTDNFRIGSPQVSFALQLFDPVRAILPSPSVDVDIVDDGDEPRIYMYVNNATEGGALTAAVWVTELLELHCSVGGASLYALPGPVTLTFGSPPLGWRDAEWGVDFLWDGVVEIPAGTRATTIELGTVVDDDLVEGGEYVRAQLVGLDGEATFDARCMGVRGQIFDND